MSRRRRFKDRRDTKDKNKYVAAALAFFLGIIGAHHFYLKNNKRGFIYIILAVFTVGIIPRIISLVEAIQYLIMSDEDFDLKYNQGYQEWNYQTRRERRSDRREYRNARAERKTEKNYRKATQAEDHKVKRTRRRNTEFKRSKRKERSRVIPGQTYKVEGIRKFKEYDIDGAIIDFEKALKVAPSDPATHFNLACAYSLTENKEESFYHLSKAVKHGFTDLDRISTHEALAYMRIQDNWTDFAERGYTLAGEKQSEQNHQPHEHSHDDEVSSNLLDQLNKLKDLRDRGLLTQDEFMTQKEKLQG